MIFYFLLSDVYNVDIASFGDMLMATLVSNDVVNHIIVEYGFSHLLISIFYAKWWP
jgi:hypothetical protein